MPFSRNGGRGPFWVCVIWPPVMWWWAFAYESFTSCTHLLLVLLLLLFFLVSSLVFASCAFNSLQPCRGVGEEGRVSKWHMVGSGFGGNTKLENTIPKSWHRTVDTWSGIQPLDTKLSLVSYFFQTVFELQECCVSTFYYQKSAFLNSIGYDKLLLDCCLIITIDLYSCVFLYWWNNCLQVENLDRKLLSSRTPDFVQYTKSFYKAGVGLNTEVGFVACSMHTWEAAFFGHFLGRGCDTFFQAEGGHLFLPGILFWSAWTVSFQASAPCVPQVRAVEVTEAGFATWWECFGCCAVRWRWDAGSLTTNWSWSQICYASSERTPHALNCTGGFGRDFGSWL